LRGIYYFIIFLVLIGLVYLGISYYTNNKEGVEVEEVLEPSAAEPSLVDKNLGNRVKAAVEKCFEEQETDYFCMAISKDDPSLCDKTTPVESNVVFKDCYDEYYSSKAILTKNRAICDNIKDATVKQICYVASIDNIESCEEFSDEDAKVFCSASVNMDASLCTGLKTEGAEKACRIIVYFLDAHNTKDIQKCDMIEDYTLNKACKSKLSGDSKFCVDYKNSACYDFNYLSEVYFSGENIDPAILEKAFKSSS